MHGCYRSGTVSGQCSMSKQEPCQRPCSQRMPNIVMAYIVMACSRRMPTAARSDPQAMHHYADTSTTTYKQQTSNGGMLPYSPYPESPSDQCSGVSARCAHCYLKCGGHSPQGPTKAGVETAGAVELKAGVKATRAVGLPTRRNQSHRGLGPFN